MMNIAIRMVRYGESWSFNRALEKTGMKQSRLMILVVGMACLALAKVGRADTCEGPKLAFPDSVTLASVESAAMAGDTHAQAQIGLIYLRGYVVKPNTATALSWLEKSAAGGSSEGQYLLGAYYLENGKSETDFRRAANYFKQSIKQGCIPSLLGLGLLTQHGNGVAKDTEAGFQMISKAAEAGYPQAQMFLGGMFIAGDGTNKDTKAGFNWVKRGADAGDSAAEILLADLYLEGIGIKPDTEAARVLLEKVYAKHDEQAPTAAYYLGWMYMEGKGVSADTLKAFRWMIIAAKYNINDSQQRLKTLTDRLPKQKLAIACSVYMDPSFATNGAKEFAHVNVGEIVAVLSSPANLNLVYFPDRGLEGFILPKCLH